jgi:hypothetical protein
MKKKSKLGCLAAVLAVVVAILVAMYLRYRSNVVLGHELRKEVDAWLAALPKIPESENGAPVITRGLGLLQPIPKQLMGETFGIDDDLEAKLLRDYLATSEEALKLIEKGLAYKKWTFTTDYEKGYLATKPNMVSFIWGVYTYVLKGDLAKREGKESEALKEYANAVRLAATLSGERCLISQMIFGSMSRTGLHWMIKLLSSAKPSQESLFAVLNALFQVHKNKAHPALAFETSYHEFIMFLSGYLTGETSDSAFSFTRSGFGWKTDVGFFFANSRFLYSFHEDVEIHRKFLEFYRKADPAKYYKFPTALRRKRRLYQKIGLEINSWNAVWAQVTLMGIEDALSIFMQNEIYLRGAIALTTIRLYQAKNGSLPGSLDELGELVPKEILIDPFSGKNLIYRRDGDDFYLYSAGYNGKDDGGKDKPIFQEEVHPEEVSDIVFHAPSAGK